MKSDSVIGRMGFMILSGILMAGPSQAVFAGEAHQAQAEESAAADENYDLYSEGYDMEEAMPAAASQGEEVKAAHSPGEAGQEHSSGY